MEMEKAFSQVRYKVKERTHEEAKGSASGAERDRKLDATRKERQVRRQQAA